MNPTLQIDHVVVAVRDLAEASRAYRALGFHVIAGGEHGHAPTRNALIVLGDGSFIELIEWTAHSPEDRWQNILETDGEGLVDFAVSMRDLAGLLDRAQRHDVQMTGPIGGSRRTVEGFDLQWEAGWPASRELPFACCDITPRIARVPDGDIRLHPNGVTGMDSIYVAVVDVPASLVRYQQLFELEGVRCSEADTVGVCMGTVDFEQTRVVLVSDATLATTEMATGVRSYVARRGQSPYVIVLRSPTQLDPINLNVADTCGVALRLCADREPPLSCLNFTLQS
ncbi:VOC family protein [Paraburkholderia sp. C35]|uniref:VOC family protein n=1 Tax=Paraburkholderia sp. C35 TaxID=2126993 RepID=UPI0013A59ED1|nr:VOC family protein [Paraburkholderia sp. C35]